MKATREALWEIHVKSRMNARYHSYRRRHWERVGAYLRLGSVALLWGCTIVGSVLLPIPESIAVFLGGVLLYMEFLVIEVLQIPRIPAIVDKVCMHTFLSAQYLGIAQTASCWDTGDPEDESHQDCLKRLLPRLQAVELQEADQEGIEHKATWERAEREVRLQLGIPEDGEPCTTATSE